MLRHDAMIFCFSTQITRTTHLRSSGRYCGTVAFAEAGESSGVPQKQVIGLLASSFLSLMTSPVKSLGGSTTLKRKVVVRKASEVSEDSQDEESEDPESMEGSFMRAPAKPKALVKSPEQEEKEAQAASLRYFVRF